MTHRVICLFLSLLMASPAIAYLPPPPPSGPIYGSFNCLFESEAGSYGARFVFREDAPLTEVVPMMGERDAYQGEFQQFPIDADEVESVDFETGGLIVIYSAKRTSLGRFTPMSEVIADNGRWMRFSSPNAVGQFETRGHCFGDIGGRLERPISLKRLAFFRIDEVSQ